MFKRLLSLLFVLVLLCSSALADIDVSSMTDAELKNLMSLCAYELRSRAASEDPEGILLLDQGGMKLYQVGDASLNVSSGMIEIPVLVVNDSDEEMFCGMDDVICNGVEVDLMSGTMTTAKARQNVSMYLMASDVGLKSLDDVYNLSGRWYVMNTRGDYLYQQEDPEEIRFW